MINWYKEQAEVLLKSPYFKAKAVKLHDGTVLSMGPEDVNNDIYTHYDILKFHGYEMDFRRDPRSVTWAFIGWDNRFYTGEELDEKVTEYERIHGPAPLDARVRFDIPEMNRSSIAQFR